MKGNPIEKIINNYEFLEIIGKGGFSIIYKVKSLKYNSFFAEKILKNNIEENNSELIILKQLDHENIIRIYDFFTYNNNTIIILEYCPSKTLMQEISLDDYFSEKKFIELAIPITEAIFYIHSQGIAHRDIKPQNILFDEYGRPKVCDFGLSLDTKCKIENIKLQGTLSFMAPEIILNICKDYIKADIWSLGVTFYYIIFQKLPYNLLNTKNYKNSIYFSSITISNKINSNLRNLLKEMLTLDPNQRINIEIVLKKLKEIKKNCPFFKSQSIHFDLIKSKKSNTFPINSLNFYKKKSLEHLTSKTFLE